MQSFAPVAVLVSTLAMASPHAASAAPRPQGATTTAATTSTASVDLMSWNAGRAYATSADGVFTLHDGTEWVRSPRVLADFRFGAEFRVSAGGEAAMLFRVLPAFNPANPKSLDGARMTLTDQSPPDGGWHRVTVEAVGTTLRVSVDGMPAQTISDANPQGLIGLTVSKGTAEFRNVQLTDVPHLKRPAPEGVFSFGAPGVTPPRPLGQPRPNYTSDAMRRRISGTVVLSAIVGVDGRPHDIRIEQSLDPKTGLDKAAVAALQGWRFTPATQQAKPVPMLITVELQFTLR